MTSQLNGCPHFFVFLFWYLFSWRKLWPVECGLSMWGKIMIPMYRLWLHSLYGLYGPLCPLSPERPLNVITHSLLKLYCHNPQGSMSQGFSVTYARELSCCQFRIGLLSVANNKVIQVIYHHWKSLLFLYDVELHGGLKLHQMLWFFSVNYVINSAVQPFRTILIGNTCTF